MAMDHDLDSLLNSQLSSDDDDDNGDLNSFYRRTIDEILDDSDSSASPPSSPPPDRRILSSASRFSPDSSLELEPRTGSLARFKSREAPSPEDLLRRSSKPLPSLFGGVRSNTKPGAALAAAAAASRSVPSPHAAAIKSRRFSLGSEGSGKVLGGGELGSDSNGDLIAKSVEISNDDEEIEVLWQNSVADNGQTLGGHEIVESALDAEHRTEGLLEVSTEQPQIDSVLLNYEINVDSDENSDSEDRNGNLESNTDNENSSEVDESSKLLDFRDDGEQGSSFLDANRNGEILELSATGESERGDSLNEEDVVDDEGSSTGDINELVEERIGQLESKRASERVEKKSQPRLKPLELAEELEKKHASTGLHMEEGAVAQPMRLEGVRRGSIALGYFDVDSNNMITRTISSQAFRRDNGSPQVLAVHTNYIAVGMARGVIVVVPSKLSPHNADEMVAKMIMLGLQGDRYASVTSLCFNQQGDLLLAGYGDGHITVWDVQRSSAAKVITGEHTAPVVHALFLGQDSQVTRQFKAITGDTKGLVLLHAFSVVPLLNRFSNKTQCLLDGQRTGTVLSASPLLVDEFLVGNSSPSSGTGTGSASGISSMMGGVVGGVFNEGSSLVEAGVVIFVTYQTALVVRLSPTLEVYAQLSRPEGVREGSMPYTAWKCTTQSQKLTTENVPAETSERVSLLAIAWDRKVQVAKLVKSELKVYSRWSLDSPAIGVAWLDDQMLVILTVTGQLYLCGNDGTVIHQTSFSVDSTSGNDLVSYHTYFNNIFGNPEKAYHNCLASRGACIYILGQAHLIVCRLLPWKERIQALRIGGDWMGSLNMAMTIYDGQAHGVVDLPRTLDAVQEAVMPYLVELLLAYVEEVFSYISVAFCNQIEKVDQLEQPSSKSSSVHHEIKEQFTRVGGVAVEFCVHIKRTDILFDEIYAKFLAVKQKDTFLELLEPYIFRDMLGSLPPEIMQALVEHYSSKGWLQRVEQCVLHMDISSLDFNQVVRLCQEHGLYGALIYLFNKGLNDFKTPLEELLAVLHNSEREAATALGYRILVYLKYCFTGLAFPPGHEKIPSSHLPTLREELLQFLLENSATINSKANSSLSPRVANLNLYPLLQLDTEATLDVLRCAVAEAEVPLPESSRNSAEASVRVQEESISMAHSPNILVQNVVDVLVNILDQDISQPDGSSISDGGLPVKDWPSKKEIGYLFDFIAHNVACGRANVSKRVLSQMMEYLTLENFGLSDSEQGVISKRREKQVLALLKVVPETDWDASYVLQLCEKARFYQVSGMIHKIRHQYLAALDTYMKDVDEPIHAFSFIDSVLLELSDNDRTTFQVAVLNRIPELVLLSREGTFLMIINLFNNEVSNVLSELRAHPKSLFMYLKTAVEVHLSGSLNFDNLLSEDKVSMNDKSEELEVYMERISDFPKFLRNNPLSLTDEMIELYLELLCQYEPDSVLKFLETFDSYRVEHCLRLCQEHGIVDAASFLLERVGDVGSALLLTLSSLNSKFTKLADVIGRGAAGIEHFRSTKNLKEVKDIEGILNACIGLCQRNTPRLNPEESEILWFRLLDSFCEPLIGSFGDERSYEGGNANGMLAETLGQRDDKKSMTKSRVPKPHKVARVWRKLFSQFIKEIVEGMIGYVRLPTIMSKLLADNCNQEFGDFKLTILGMLGTYGFERRILNTAKSLIEDDTYYTMSLLKKGAAHGYAPRSQVCCICNGLLTKSLSSSSIRVFHCGHATHLQCEALENGTSGLGSSSGCPVCMPNNKRTQRSKNKSVLVENGLVKKISSRPHQAHGMAVFPHDIDSSDYGYGVQQMSRFEMLSMLQKEQRFVQVESIPQLRLAPPAVYHEKVKKGTDLMTGESSSNMARTEKQLRNKQLKDLKIKGSSLRFPLKSSIFGKEKMSKR